MPDNRPSAADDFFLDLESILNEPDVLPEAAEAVETEAAGTEPEVIAETEGMPEREPEETADGPDGNTVGQGERPSGEEPAGPEDERGSLEDISSEETEDTARNPDKKAEKRRLKELKKEEKKKARELKKKKKPAEEIEEGLDGDSTDEELESTGNAKRTAVFYGIAVVILTGITVFALYKASSWIDPAILFGKRHKTTAAVTSNLLRVPDITGKTREEALAVATNAGFGIKYVEEQYSDEKEGLIISQSPEAGEKAEPNSTIRYIISCGQKVLAVPDLSGKTLVEAESLLWDEGFLNVSIKSIEDASGLGSVRGISAKTSARVQASSEIMIAVSSGEDHQDVQVGNYVGKKWKDAAREALSDGYIAQIRQGFSDVVEEGSVIAQNLVPFSWSPKGSVVTLHVSCGPGKRDPGKEKDVTLSAPYTYSGSEAWLVLREYINGKIYDTQLGEPYENVTFPLSVRVATDRRADVSEITMYEKTKDGTAQRAKWRVQIDTNEAPLD